LGTLVSICTDLGLEGEDIEDLQQLREVIKDFLINSTAIDDFTFSQDILNLMTIFEERRRNVYGIARSILEFKNQLNPKHQAIQAPQFDAIGSLINKLDQISATILVVGDSSAGKSSLINMLLGADILPSSPTPCTSTICEVRYGEKAFAKVYQNNKEFKVFDLSKDPPAATVLKPYLCAEGDIRFTFSPYSKVEVYWPSPLLKYGLILVDSPGFGDNEVMSEISRNYSTQATGLLCVVNSSRGVVTLPFREYMGQVPDTLGSANSLFICNKSDQVDLHEKDAVMKNIQKSAKKVWPNLRNDQFFYFDTCKALNFHSKYGIMESEEIKIRHKFNEFLAQNLTERVRYLAECAREEFAFIANFIESLSLDEKKRKRCSIFLRNSKKHLRGV